MLKNIKNKSKKNRKGFTLIELIVVMAVIGILVLVAAPKFIGYTQKAELTKIQNDSRVVGTLVDAYLVGGEELVAGTTLSDVELNSFASEGKLYDLKGPVESARPGTYTLLSKEFSGDSKLKGEFYANDMGDIYYVGTRAIGGNVSTGGGTSVPEGEVALTVEMLQEEINWLMDANPQFAYTPESWVAFESAIINAEGVVASGTSNQQELNGAFDALASGEGQLVPKETAPLSAPFDAEVVRTLISLTSYSVVDINAYGIEEFTLVNGSDYTLSIHDYNLGSNVEILSGETKSLSLDYNPTSKTRIMIDHATSDGLQVVEYLISPTSNTSAEIILDANMIM